MDPFIDRISNLEKNLERLVNDAGNISSELESLKQEFKKPIQAEAAIPPPLPEEPLPCPIIQEPVVLKTKESSKEVKTQPIPKRTEKNKYNGGLELQLGRVWFVRIGIILLTTGLVFLSSYTYHNYVRDLAPGTRLGLFYAFAAVITGIGLFCESWKDSLKSYGRIVAAGGLATIYYCSFAAYHVDALKVIESPITASLLLTLSAGLFCGVSLWKHSRLMLSTSLGLAFYSISINPNGIMVCVSSLILATFGITMMHRTKWVSTGFVVLIGSYLSYAWWQLTIAHSSIDTQIFLTAYWLLFVGTSLLPNQVNSEKNQGIFSSINHSAFFLLFSLNLQTFTFIDYQWAFSLSLGVALVGIGLLGRKRLPDTSIILHLTKGVGLITLGLSLKLTGHILFLTLLLESLLLLAICLRHPHPFARVASQLVAALGLGVALYHYLFLHSVPAVAWSIAATLCLAYGILDRVTRDQFVGDRENPISILFSLLFFGFIVFGSTSAWSPEHRCFLVAIPGLLVPLSFRNETVKRLGHDLLLVAMFLSPVALVSLLTIPTPPQSIFLTGAIISIVASALHSRFPCLDDFIPKNVFAGVHLAIATLLIVLDILTRDLTGGTQILLLLLIPILGTLASRQTKLIIHSIIPALAYASIPFVNSVETDALLMGTLLCVGHLLLLKKIHTLGDKGLLEGTSYLFATALFLLWILGAFTEPLVIVSWAAVGILLSARFMPRLLTYFPAAFYFLISAVFFIMNPSPAEVYLAVLAPAALHLWNSHQNNSPHFNILAVIALLGLWIQVTRDCSLSSLSAAWGITGTLVLLIGLLFRSRAFRLSALLILLASLGHVMLFDIVKLDPLPRILSFITLGLGLLALGFVYNRWQERLKHIL